jgi:hypothetical protein
MSSNGVCRLVVALLAVTPAAAISAPVDMVYTLSKGSAERTAILDGLRAHEQDKTRFIVHAMHVFHSGARAIATVNAEAYPARIATIDSVLVREGDGPWKVVWGVGCGRRRLQRLP